MALTETERAKLQRESAAEYYAGDYENDTDAQMAAKILKIVERKHGEFLAKKESHSTPTNTGSLRPLAASRDKFVRAMSDGFVSGQESPRNALPRCLAMDGHDARTIDRLSVTDQSKSAMGFPVVGVRADATMVTTTLAEIIRDTVNKSLLAGYTESPQTWKGPMRQAASVADFKDINRVRLGAVPNLPAWPDNTVPETAILSNEKVSYAVEARAEKICFSWQLFVNDDLDALTRVPRLMGDAAARTVNAVAWAQVTSNPTMSYDSVALFAAATGSRKRTNLITGAASPTTATIGAMKALMRQMRGLNTPEGNESQDILNLVPRYLVCPSTLETTCGVLVNSSAEPAATYSSGVYNPNSNLLLVVEPLLDAVSTTGWYLFADPRRVDTVEVAFLQGQETPVTNDWIDHETLSRNFTIIQTFAAKAIDHRGMVKHAGA